jgi:mannose-1-phosphate guanylyltransferase
MLLPVIMAGGSGSRLWPLSRQLNPKQFLCLTDAHLSMLQQTITRLEGANVALPQLICNEQHRFLVAEQLRQLGMEQASILLEPSRRSLHVSAVRTAARVALSMVPARLSHTTMGAPSLSALVTRLRISSSSLL